MDGPALAALVASAATIGVAHTLLGPDHYLPFVVLARSRRWSLGRALAVTAVCGAGHVVGSIALGAAGIALGWAVAGLVDVEALRGDLAGRALLGVGLAWTVWGVREARRRRPHSHLHAHGDGLVHRHPHGHAGEHAHPHDVAGGGPGRPGRWLGPWSLFVVFVVGPCEPLIPLLMVPAAGGGWGGVALVAAVFAAVTLLTMLAAVAFGVSALARLPAAAGLERWSHAVAGAALALCGVAVTLGL